MRNLKKVLCLALVLTMILAVVSGAAYTNYVDDADITSVNSEYLIAAQLFQDLGIVIGKEENGEYKYDPKGDFDRASMARVLYVLHTDFEEQNPYNQGSVFADLYCTFKDIDGVWAAPYIKYGFAQGYLSGRNATTFDPYAPVTAQEMATALLAVLGYNKADLAKNYPNNVVKYSYTKEHNLFSTGLSVNEGATAGGHHIVALYGSSWDGKELKSPDREAETELGLTQALNREQAFYMMFKAITKFGVVKKNEGNISLEDGKLVATVSEYNVLENGKGAKLTYLEKHFGFNVEKSAQKVGGVVIATADKKISGIAGDVAKNGNTFTILQKNGTPASFIDFGYEATLANKQGGGPYTFYSFNLNPVDWNSKLFTYVDFYTYSWGNKTYAVDYQFDVVDGEYTGVSNFSGEVVKTTKAVGIHAVKKADGTNNSDKISIGGKEYELYNGAYLSVNGSKYSKVADAAALLTAIGDADASTQNADGSWKEKGLSSDPVTLYIANGKIFAVDEMEYSFAKVVIDDANKLRGTMKLIDVGSNHRDFTVNCSHLGLEGNGEEFVNGIGAKNNDLIRFYVDGEDDKYGLPIIKGYVLEKTALENVSVKKETGKTDKFFMEDGTEIVFGKYKRFNTNNYRDVQNLGASTDDEASLYATLAAVVANSKYVDLYIDGGLVYAAVPKAKTKAGTVESLTFKSIVETYNTATKNYDYVVSFTGYVSSDDQILDNKTTFTWSFSRDSSKKPTDTDYATKGRIDINNLNGLFNGYQVIVDAKTGEVVRFEKDS